ncbi:sugar phosphate isomerase/epimerase [Maribellus sp. CM-23]|uniref:sugar phosphate isomerase/epimerase n=1 Tax=Maribellus sp. CM-23 TaxID=2781026 RepID=UPI001F3DB808|nr:sugar phosphate isomerase/epimerase [Maribellus sp. CM-23]MCE4565826.1 sugar phosphate isomerase/epimerase [Maribellus sp. CM-23]
MKKYIFHLIVLVLLASCSQKNLTLTNNNFQIEINSNGQIKSLCDRQKMTEYFPENQISYLLSLRADGTIVHPDKLVWNEDNTSLHLTFKSINTVAQIKVEQKSTHTTFELLKIEGNSNPDLAIWGPFATTINKTVGECVGVVRNDDFAIGIQALNIKTLGGYPTNEDDTEPAYDIFASSNLVDIGDSVKVLYRGQTAKYTEFGSVLQAYCRDRSHDRIIPVWKHDNYEVPAFDDGGLTGTKIALFGCAASNALETIGKVEIEEGLPHPEIEGEWGKTANAAMASYLIQSFSEDNLDRAIELTKKAGLKYLYHGGPFKNWGHFDLQEKPFPDNWESMKRCVERAEKRGVRLGLHTLSNFITTNDPYVTPIPDPRLAKVGSSKLTSTIDENATEIVIEDPMFFNQMKNNSLHALVIDNEIVRYAKVSETEPWTLLDCERGAFNTQKDSHQKGTIISKLMDHGYKTFLTNNELSDEMAVKIADLFNYTGLRQISFDGLEGNWSTGMGQYGRTRFVKKWYDSLKPELQGKVINDASNPGHYFWHMFTRMNWGEPWYAGFRESQTQYRLMNQDFYRRNLMPCMLGWFSMSEQISLEDVEWLLARAAGFDAGFALTTSEQVVAANGLGEQLLETIAMWEQLRHAGAFSAEQKKLMENIKNEFHLVPASENSWTLYQYKIDRFEHKQKTRQPGEPVFSKFEFENTNGKQALQFILTAPDETAISNLSFDIDNFKRVGLAVNIPAKHHLKYEGGEHAVVYSPTWNKVKTVDINAGSFEVDNGSCSLIFDCKFVGESDSPVKLELKTIDEGELITL